MTLSPLLHFENRPAPGGGEHYGINGGAIGHLRAAEVELIDLSERLAERNRPSHEMLLDLVHLTPSGHTHVANLLEPYLMDLRRETVRGR